MRERRVVAMVGLCVVMLAPLFAAPLAAQTPSRDGTIRGVVVDPLGAVIAGASVSLLKERQPVGETASGTSGEFLFERLASGRYAIEVGAQGFESRTVENIFVGASDRASVEIALPIGPLQQTVAVTAAATETSLARTSAPVTVLDASILEALEKPEVLEALRLVPGAQVARTGQRGSASSLFIRGGASNFTKVMIDGVTANDIGGAIDFATIATTGIDRVEVLRSSNSVLYGSDALAGVVSLSTRRGSSVTPEFTYALDGGNLSTLRQDAAIGGAVERFDYFSEYSYFTTDNDVPNNGFRNHTYAGRFGVALGSATDLSGTVRHIDGRYGSPNAILYFGVPDDSRQKSGATYVSVTARSQLTPRWSGTARFTSTSQRFENVNPTPSGEPFDPFGFGANYLGEPVTIRGANGFVTSGRAILDFGGVFPSLYEARVNRQTVYLQSDHRLHPSFELSGGLRIEHESGWGDAGTRTETTRNNAGAFVEARGVVARRLYLHGGLGVERNAVFGTTAVPRAGAAFYVRMPEADRNIGDTRITFNIGRGIKAPSIAQETSSLFALLETVAVTLPAVEKISPERSRSADVGIEQALWRNRARVRVAYFDNEFSDLIEYVSKNVLPQLGVPPEVAAATAFGAYVNSSSYTARGLETSADAMVGDVRIMASYMYLAADVTESFGSSALQPSFNPAYPTEPIGAFAPLVGARPFRRPAHSGNLLVSYTRGPAQIAVAAYFSGKQDDSTFLSDEFFGSSMLLPNKNLIGSYQKFDLSGAYRLHPRVRWYASIENLFDREYQAVSGFPALPRALRTGVSLTLGGRTP